MTILIRGRRPGEDPAPNQTIRPYSDFSSHNTWGTDHFGFLYQGDLMALCADLRKKGVSFPVELKKGVGGSLLCYVAAPDGVMRKACCAHRNDPVRLTATTSDHCS